MKTTPSRFVRTMRACVKPVGIGAAMLMLSGCFAQGSAKGPAKNPTSSASAGKDVQATLAPGFDNAKAWRAEEGDRAYDIAAAAGLFVDVYALGETEKEAIKAKETSTPGASRSPSKTSSAEPSSSPSAGDPANGSVVVGRSITDGSVVWTSAPLKGLTDQKRARLRVIDTPRGAHVVVVRVGIIPALGMDRLQRRVVVDVFPVVAAGPDVVAMTHAEIPVEELLDDEDVAIGDGGVLVKGRVDGRGGIGPGALFEPLTGQVTPAPPGLSREITDCGGSNTCRLQYVATLPTAFGMLAIEYPERLENRFAVGDRWASEKVAPKDKPNGTVMAVSPTAIVVAWRAAKDDPPLYLVHDLATGAVIATADCPPAAKTDSGALRWGAEDTSGTRGIAEVAHTSPNGRYLVAGPLVVDLSGGVAKCRGIDSTTRGVLFTTVDNKGTAYGNLIDPDARTNNGRQQESVVVHSPFVQNEALPPGNLVPEAVSATGVGVFHVPTPTSGDKRRLILVAPPGSVAPPSAK